MSASATPSAIILYHFFYPDDVVSARHFSDFAEELANRDWEVTVLTSNRYCRSRERKIAVKEEVWKGIRVIRISRPGWQQANDILRIIIEIMGPPQGRCDYHWE
jgi:colanic acid biosynthesis glycosyl transferase WcaI